MMFPVRQIFHSSSRFLLVEVVLIIIEKKISNNHGLKQRIFRRHYLSRKSTWKSWNFAINTLKWRKF